MKSVYGYTVHSGGATLFDLVESKALKRRYLLHGVVDVVIHCDDGDQHCYTDKFFVFDGRSGGRWLDWFAPNLGSLDERIAWWMHDCLGYAQSLSFEDTNKMLQLFLRDVCGYNRLKAWIIRKAVSISKSWYGMPKDETDWCYCNIERVNTVWIPKICANLTK